MPGQRPRVKRQAKASWPWWQLPADFEAHRLAVLVSAVASAIGHQVDELKAAAIPRPRDRWPGSHRETARKQASTPGTIRPRWVRSFQRGFPALVTDAPRIEWIRGALSRRAASQLWWYMSVPVEMPVVCTWTLGTLAATAGIAEPTKADPARPSATIAGMMMARPMRMTPPCQTSRPGPRQPRSSAPKRLLELSPIFGRRILYCRLSGYQLLLHNLRATCEYDVI